MYVNTMGAHYFDSSNQTITATTTTTTITTKNIVYFVSVQFEFKYVNMHICEQKNVMYASGSMILNFDRNTIATYQ